MHIRVIMYIYAHTYNSYLYMLVFLVIIIPFNNIYHLRRQDRSIHEDKNNVTSRVLAR